MVLVNGRLDVALLASVPGQPYLRLDPAASRSWGRLRDDLFARHGWRVELTDAYRALEGYWGQRETFLRRYTRTWNPDVSATPPRTKLWDSDSDGVRETWYLRRGQATAATPGTSNHGWGLAVDVKDLGNFRSSRYQQFAQVAATHGWDNVEGSSIGEPWHWVYKPRMDRHAGATAPATNTDEDDDMAAIDELRTILARIEGKVDQVMDEVRGVPSAFAAVQQNINTARDEVAGARDGLMGEVRGVPQAFASVQANIDDTREAILAELADDEGTK